MIGIQRLCRKAEHGYFATNVGLSMSITSLLKTFTIVLIASAALFSQQSATPSSPPDKPAQQPPAQQEPKSEGPANPKSSPSPSPTQPETTSSPANEAKEAPAAAAQPVLSPQKKAWEVLNAACTGDKTNSRAIATRVLGLIPNKPRARKMAEKGLADDKPEVRAAAAAALGQMKSKGSIPKLKGALQDDDPTVALAAAHALNLMHDDSAYDVYQEILTGQRTAGKGLIASQTAILKDPRKMAQLGFEEGIGFIPFAGIGWEAFKVIKKDDASPVRAAAAKVLANDPDPDAEKALTDAVGDKSWLVRAAAIEALATRGDPSAIDTITPYVFDEKDAVKYTAAAAVVRLTTIQEAKNRKNDSKKMEQKK